MLKAVCSCGKTEMVFLHLRELPNPWVRGCCLEVQIKAPAQEPQQVELPPVPEAPVQVEMPEPEMVEEAAPVSDKPVHKAPKKAPKSKGSEPQ